MTDGSVELLVEGNEVQASHMVDEVNHRMSEYWHKKKTDERAGDAHFSEFIIQQWTKKPQQRVSEEVENLVDLIDL